MRLFTIPRRTNHRFMPTIPIRRNVRSASLPHADQVQRDTTARLIQHQVQDTAIPYSLERGRLYPVRRAVGTGKEQDVDAAASLLTLASRVATLTGAASAALGVITVAGYGYQRPDGVHVIRLRRWGRRSRD
jgi:hypothetical protein